MDMYEIGALCKSHTPTRKELQELYAEDKDGYDNAVASYEHLWEEARDPHAALKEMHRMESGLNSVDASFGQRQVLDGPIPDIARSELPNIGFPVYDESVNKIIAGLSRQKIADAIEWKDDSGFMKNDAGKNMVSLVDPAFVLLLGEILTFGAKKYAPNNWQLCEDTSRYKDALLRHIYAYLAGEKVDPESGLSHLGHAAFGLMCLNYFDQKEQN